MNSSDNNIFAIALGGNITSAEQKEAGLFVESVAGTLHDAILCLAGDPALELKSVSRFFRTPCFPVGAGPDYVNAAALLRSDLSARAFLKKMHEIERSFGRVRQSRWGARSLDLDLLAQGGRIMPDRTAFENWRNLPPEEQSRKAPSELILPHPRMQDRAFVLVPLMDIAPDWTHPVLGQTVAKMLESLPKNACGDITPL